MPVAQKVVPLSKAKQARLIDELGALKAQIATLQDQYDQKVAVFKEFGFGEYVGNQFKLTVYEASRVTLDQALVKGLLTPAEIKKVSKLSVSVVAKLGVK